MYNRLPWRSAFILVTLAGCAAQDATTTAPAATRQPSFQSSASGGAQTPPFNLEIILRGVGFGLVKFRQPNDGSHIVRLGTWVSDLAPNTAYLLQRAVDTNVDGNCTGSAWLTLGKGSTPQAIMTNALGTGRQELFRNLSAVAPGTSFDIHFRVIEAATSAVVLTSTCYQFTVR